MFSQQEKKKTTEIAYTRHHLQGASTSGDVSYLRNFIKIFKVMGRAIFCVQQQVITGEETRLRSIKKKLSYIHNRISWVQLHTN